VADQGSNTTCQALTHLPALPCSSSCQIGSSKCQRLAEYRQLRSDNRSPSRTARPGLERRGPSQSPLRTRRTDTSAARVDRDRQASLERTAADEKAAQVCCAVYPHRCARDPDKRSFCHAATAAPRHTEHAEQEMFAPNDRHLLSFVSHGTRGSPGRHPPRLDCARGRVRRRTAITAPPPLELSAPQSADVPWPAASWPTGRSPTAQPNGSTGARHRCHA